MRRPLIADLFCGAGGAAMGLSRAGFEVVGFDIAPQPHYPFAFVRQDALTVDLSPFDAVWASPPCQAYSIMRNLPWLRDKEYPRLIAPTRELLDLSGKPWIIENVMGAHLPAGWLCGQMFGRPFYRHRAFETNWFWLQPGHPKHTRVISHGYGLGSRARRIVYGEAEDRRGLATWPGRRGVPAGLAVTEQAAGVREAMDIDWMVQEELRQAIPPAYSEYLGGELLKQI